MPGLQQSAQHVRGLRKHLGPHALIYTMSNFPSARDLKTDLKAAGASECFEKPLHADSFTFILKQLDDASLDAPQKLAA